MKRVALMVALAGPALATGPPFCLVRRSAWKANRRKQVAIDDEARRRAGIRFVYSHPPPRTPLFTFSSRAGHRHLVHRVGRECFCRLTQMEVLVHVDQGGLE